MRPEDHEWENEPGPPNHEDACMVCDRVECVCPPETDESFPSLLESEEQERIVESNRSQFGPPR